MTNSKKQQKASDWKRVQEEHPEQAEFITAMSAVFGKPASVQVKTDEGDVILDTDRYR
jgi:hypothetical protein